MGTSPAELQTGEDLLEGSKFKGRMAAKELLCFVFFFALATLAASQRYDQKTTTYPPTYPTTKKYPTHPTYPPTKNPTTKKYPTHPPAKYPTTKKYPTHTPAKYPTTKKYPLHPTPPTHPGGYHKSLCECINPFTGYPHAYRGDSDTLCGPQGPGVCYVDCNADCRDIKPTASASRCKSSLACDISKGAEWQ